MVKGKKNSVLPFYPTSPPNEDKVVLNSSANARSKRFVKQQKESSEYNPSTKRRNAGGFFSSTCCKGIIAALMTIAIIAAFALPFIIVITTQNKGTESTTTTTEESTTTSLINSTTGATTASVPVVTTGVITASPTNTTTGATVTASPTNTTSGATVSATTANSTVTATTKTTTTTTTRKTTTSTSTSTTTTVFSTGWNKTAKTVAGTGSSGTSPSTFNKPIALAIDSSRALYIADRLNNRVQQWLNGSSSGSTVAGSSSGISGSSLSSLYTPLDVELDSDGNFYIADSDNNRVVLWNVSATFGIVVAGTGTQGSANNQLNAPYGIVHDWTTGTLYIADTYNDRIMSYASGASTGTFCIGGTGFGTTQLKFPTGLYFDSSSNSLYITNTDANNIVRWVVGASNWILVAGSSSGTAGLSSTLLDYPRDVTLDYMKNVYVADSNNNRIQFYKAGQSNGTTIVGSVAGVAGSNTTLLNSPISLVLDSDLNLYVADYFNHRIQRFDHY